MAKLSTAQRKAMPASEFADGKPKGKPEGSFPLNDKKHIAAAESYERFATPAEKTKIDATADKAFPKRGERTAKSYKAQEARHPSSHAEFERLGNED